MDKNLYGNIGHLKANDEVKFVLSNQADYDWARFKLDEYKLAEKCSDVLFSPVYGELNPSQLAQWILDDRLQVRMQLQMHKLIWGEEQGR
jgi:7-carboxy-7-deazaguanine synthase